MIAAVLALAASTALAILLVSSSKLGLAWSSRRVALLASGAVGLGLVAMGRDASTLLTTTSMGLGIVAITATATGLARRAPA